MLQIGIVVAGQDYQEAAAWAAATYVRHLESSDALTVFLPVDQGPVDLLKQHARSFGFAIDSFAFRTVSQSKFTSQLKCQGFHHAVSRLTNGDILLLVDADTYCLGPIELRAQLSPANGSERGSVTRSNVVSQVALEKSERVLAVHAAAGHRPALRFKESAAASRTANGILSSFEQGSIGLVRDIQDRHDEETTSSDPWYLAPDERLFYVNSGIIAAGRASLELFEKFRELSEQPAFLRGPFNDQKVINFALGRHFRDKLVLLDEGFNYIHRPGQFQCPPHGTIIGHCAGGAGWISYADGYRKRAHQKICEAILQEKPWPF